MQDKYDKYYWQNDKVRLRAMGSDDDNFAEKLDSESWAMAAEELVLPPVKREAKEATEDDLKAWQDESKPVFSIENLEGDYVGHIQFNDINERHGTCEIGVSIWRNYKNKGYGKAAVEIILGYIFNERRLNKVNADCIDCNIASISLMKSLGFQQEGTVREAIFYHGKFHSRLIFGLTANEYRLRSIV